MAFINQSRLIQTGNDGGSIERSDFEWFMHYATSSNIGERELAVRNVAKTMHTLDPGNDQCRMERFIGMVESIFEKDDDVRVKVNALIFASFLPDLFWFLTDSQLRCILLEQLPTIYSEFSNSGVLGNRIQEVFSSVIVDSLIHFSDQEGAGLARGEVIRDGGRGKKVKFESAPSSWSLTWTVISKGDRIEEGASSNCPL
ncbi:unnamed protein product [Toxocara canis]|uniref:Telomere length regulation protein TEL2 homolog n=1 Tax=Toxocara canis TaxID=6265 RepID=A0A183UFS2_TOXCA|nr:unnamed protein product [Toxocara canis]